MRSSLALADMMPPPIRSSPGSVLGWGGVWWGGLGVIPFFGSCTWAVCYAMRSSLARTRTLMVASRAKRLLVASWAQQLLGDAS